MSGEKNDKEYSVTEQIEFIKAEICDDYCKYPELYRDEIVLMEKCKECVLGKL